LRLSFIAARLVQLRSTAWCRSADVQLHLVLNSMARLRARMV
tara:strand:- start:18277 stop:18402 length:126 start_codon:yes stop_codon:yes gene_type:complete